MTEKPFHVKILDYLGWIHQGSQTEQIADLCSERGVPLRFTTKTGYEVVLCRPPSEIIDLSQIHKQPLRQTPLIELQPDQCSDCRFHLPSPHISRDRPAQPNSENLALWSFGEPSPDRLRR